MKTVLTPATTPDEYIGCLTGWQRSFAEALRNTVRAAAPDLQERLKWGHLVYFSSGPVLIIRAEPKRVLFGFMRGQRLRHIEPRLKPGGKYELATLELHQDTPLRQETVVQLAVEAERLNRAFGDPTAAAHKPAAAKAKTLTRAELPSELIDAKIESLGDWRGEMLARLRALIKEADPEVTEEWKWRIPVWSHNGLVCTGETYKKVVKTTFAKGASLPDPSGLFNSSLEGKVRRAIDFHEGDKLDEKALKALVGAAVALNKSSGRG